MAHVLTLLRTGWGRFRRFRGGRPFWGGFLLAAAGVELLVAPAAQSLILPIDLIVFSGVAGVSGWLIAALLITLGVLSWLQPGQNLFFGIVGLLLALASFVTSNFGGFVIGMLLGVVGGALVFAWGPDAGGRPRRGRRGARGPADAEADGPADRTVTGAEGTDEAPPDGPVRTPPPESGPLSALALPLALTLTLAGASAPALDWPWDWLVPPDEEEQTEPSPSPSPEPTDGPSESEGDGEEDDPGEDPQEEPGEEHEEEHEEEPEEGDPDACEPRTGESALAGSEEEFLEAVRACEAAREAGELPETAVAEGYDCSTGSVRTSGLTADRLTMSGARYDGVVECPTADGPRRFLRLSMSGADFSGAELWFEDAGTRMSLGLPTMTMDGSVRMHITRMHVRILGIPLTFTPDFPPPLLLPHMVVTDVDVDDPLAQTDLMRIPDLNGRYGGV